MNIIYFYERVWTNLFLEILPVDIKIGIHYRIFCGNNFVYKKFQEIGTQESETRQKGNNVLKFCELHKIFAKLRFFYNAKRYSPGVQNI